MSRILEATTEHEVKKLNTEAKLLKTTLNDPHVKKVMQALSKGDPSIDQKIVQAVHEKMVEFSQMASLSPILYEAAFDNVVENTLFEIADHLHQGAPAEGASTFDVATFNKLVRLVKAETKSMFPLRSMVDYHVIHEPRFSITGNGDDKVDNRFKGVGTACATADGTFVFNKRFVQQFINFAAMKGVKPPANRFGKKYASNGGPIPDDYQFVEFLIRHELMHYTYSDFHYQKVIPNANPKIINYVGDFRSNYQLIQQGFTQPPCGLFSSYVNFHRQTTYQEMYDIVEREFKKLNKHQQQQLQDLLDKLSDHHDELGKNTDGTDKQVTRKVNKSDIDNWNKRNDKKAQEEGAKIENDAPPDFDNKPPEKRDPGTSKGGKHEIDYTRVQPKYKWDQLLRKMIAEASFNVESSYQKISRRAIGTMQQIAVTKRGAVKPGEIKNPSKKKIKLAVIIDSSGSMSYVIREVMHNVDKLLVQRATTVRVQDEFYLMIFSGDYDIYNCTPGKAGVCQHIKSIDKQEPGELGKLKLIEVLNQHKSGGTVFSSELKSEINKLAARGYNCLIVTDGDLLYGSNFDNFKELYTAHKKNVFLLLDSRQTFNAFVSQMKELSNNTSYINAD